jgi:MFS family permease
VSRSFVRDFCTKGTAYSGGYGSYESCNNNTDLSAQPSGFILFKSIISAFISVGSAIGALCVAPFVADRIGRARTLALGAFIAAVGVGITVSATSRALLITGRLVDGLGTGTIAFATPVYIAEVSPPAKRGVYGSFVQLALVLGLAAALALSFAPLTWRLILAAPILPSIVLLIGAWFLPESSAIAARRRHALARAEATAADALAHRLRADAGLTPPLPSDADAPARAAAAAAATVEGAGRGSESGGPLGVLSSAELAAAVLPASEMALAGRRGSSSALGRATAWSGCELAPSVPTVTELQGMNELPRTAHGGGNGNGHGRRFVATVRTSSPQRGQLQAARARAQAQGRAPGGESDAKYQEEEEEEADEEDPRGARAGAGVGVSSAALVSSAADKGKGLALQTLQSSSSAEAVPTTMPDATAHPATPPAAKEAAASVSTAARVKELFTEPPLRRRVVIAWSLVWLQQLTGINAFMAYSTTIFADAGVSNALVAAVVLMVINVIGTLVAMSLIDRVGRRALLAVGSLTMCLMLVLAGLLLLFAGKGAGGAASAFVVIACAAFVFAYAIGWGPVPWIIPSEIFPQTHRTVGVTSTVAIQWLATCVIVFVTPPLLAAAGIQAVLLIFAGFCAVGLLFSLLVLPETKGVVIDSERMDALFGGKKSQHA